MGLLPPSKKVVHGSDRSLIDPGLAWSLFSGADHSSQSFKQFEFSCVPVASPEGDGDEPGPESDTFVLSAWLPPVISPDIARLSCTQKRKESASSLHLYSQIPGAQGLFGLSPLYLSTPSSSGAMSAHGKQASFQLLGHSPRFSCWP